MDDHQQEHKRADAQNDGPRTDLDGGGFRFAKLVLHLELRERRALDNQLSEVADDIADETADRRLVTRLGRLSRTIHLSLSSSGPADSRCRCRSGATATDICGPSRSRLPPNRRNFYPADTSARNPSHRETAPTP